MPKRVFLLFTCFVLHNQYVLMNFQGLDSIDVGPQSTTLTTNGTGDTKITNEDSTLQLQTLEDRRAPEGKDNDSMADHELIDGSKEKAYTTDVNGKVTVHVVVTINGNGTLADLKKQRMQIRNSSSDVSSLTSPVNSIPDGEVIVPSTANTADIVRFTGETEEAVDYSKSKGCCSVQ